MWIWVARLMSSISNSRDVIALVSEGILPENFHLHIPLQKSTASITDSRLFLKVA